MSVVVVDDVTSGDVCSRFDVFGHFCRCFEFHFLVFVVVRRTPEAVKMCQDVTVTCKCSYSDAIAAFIDVLALFSSTIETLSGGTPTYYILQYKTLSNTLTTFSEV